MKLILNDKEIIRYLTTLLGYSDCYKDIDYNQRNTAEAIGWSLERKDKLWKFRDKIKERLYHAVREDLKIYISKIQLVIESKKQKDTATINSKFNLILEKLDEKNVIDMYKNSSIDGFCKSPGLILNPNAELIRRKDYTDFSEDCLFRNMEGNESLILDKIKNNFPFWFIDTGYTNFLNGKKKTWHRLVRNNLHHSKMFEAPVNRLGNFESFPLPWRDGGEKILLIEPGMFSAKTFNVDIKSWTNETIKEIRKYTDKKIVIREKLSKKVRKNLYKELLDEDYYCVININSNAAVESIWAGVPTITLYHHISNSVSRNKISDINNLYKGSLSNWLSMLSYSQFTYQEIIDGTAIEIMRKYHV